MCRKRGRQAPNSGRKESGGSEARHVTEMESETNHDTLMRATDLRRDIRELYLQIRDRGNMKSIWITLFYTSSSSVELFMLAI